MSGLVEKLESALQDEVGDHQALGEDYDRLVLAVEDYVERGLIDRDELLRIARRGG